MVHRVEPRTVSARGLATASLSGCEVAIDLIAPPPLERAVAAAYGPVMTAALRRLARRAEAA